MYEMPQIAAVSQVHKEAPAVGAMLKDGPVLLTARAERYAVLVSVDQWNSIVNELKKIDDLREINELLRLEIDRLESGADDGDDFDEGELERIAGRV